MNRISALLREYWENWQRFWFGEQDLLPVSALRAVISFLFLIFVVSRGGDLEIFYTNKGFIPSSYVSSVKYLTYQHSIFHVYDSLALVTICHYALLASLFCLMIGFCTRISAVVSYFLLLMFVNRNPAVQYGVDFIGMFFFFYLMFADSGACLSVDSWLRNRKTGKNLELGPVKSDILSSVAIRLMQIQISVIYFYSGIAKLKGSRWWNGSAIWDVLTMEGLIRFDMSFVAYIPDALVIACYTVLLWGNFFPVLIWVKPFRKPLILFGLVMHISFGYFLQIPIFGAMMCAVYLIFHDPQALREFLARFMPKRAL